MPSVLNSALYLCKSKAAYSTRILKIKETEWQKQRDFCPAYNIATTMLHVRFSTVFLQNGEQA